jgi:hypothetical protein
MADRGRRIRLAAAVSTVSVALALAPGAAATERPRYDVPGGYIRCPAARAWNGFFKWASVRRTTCRYAADFMRAYAAKAAGGQMPRCLRGFRCRIRFWRNADGDIYASRHSCTRRAVTVRFYGMA